MQKHDLYTVVGLVMLAGGFTVFGKKLNQYKKLGPHTTNIGRIVKAFMKLEDAGFGLRDNEYVFTFHNDVLEFCTKSNEALSFISEQGLSVAMFAESLSITSKKCKTNAPGPGCSKSLNPVNAVPPIVSSNLVNNGAVSSNPLVHLSNMHVLNLANPLPVFVTQAAGNQIDDQLMYSTAEYFL